MSNLVGHGRCLCGVVEGIGILVAVIGFHQVDGQDVDAVVYGIVIGIVQEEIHITASQDAGIERHIFRPFAYAGLHGTEVGGPYLHHVFHQRCARELGQCLVHPLVGIAHVHDDIV